MPRQTPSQTAGPYVHIGLAPQAAGLTEAPKPLGVAEGDVVVMLRLFDGEGAPVTDALIETFPIWQRAVAEDGIYRLHFETLPEVTGLWIAARGLNAALVTRAYAPGVPIEGVPQDRAEPLRLQQRGDGFHMNIHLQRPEETIFFEI